MDVRINDSGISVKKASSDIEGNSWFDSTSEGVLFIRIGEDVIKAYVGDDYDSNFEIAKHMDEMWKETEIGQIFIVDNENDRLLIVQPNDPFANKRSFANGIEVND